MSIENGLFMFIGFILLLFIICSIVGFLLASLYSKKQKNNAVISVVAWSNVITWIFPFIGIATAIATYIFARRGNTKNKRKYIILATLCLVLIMLVYVGGFIWLNVQGFMINPHKYNYDGLKLDKESKQFVDTEVPKILSGNVQELINNADQHMFATTPASQIDKIFTQLETLYGQLQLYDGSTGQTIFYTVNINKTAIVAEYISKVKFTNSLALVTTYLTFTNGHWKILSFIISPVKGLNYPPITRPVPALISGAY